MPRFAKENETKPIECKLEVAFAKDSENETKPIECELEGAVRNCNRLLCQRK
jgi:hypothetical protein